MSLLDFNFIGYLIWEYTKIHYSQNKEEWGYTPGRATRLPLVLKPHEVYETVMQVCVDVREGERDGRIRFGSVPCVFRQWCVEMGMGMEMRTGSTGGGGYGTDVVKNRNGMGRSMVTVGTDVRCTTARVVRRISEKGSSGSSRSSKVDTFWIDLVVKEARYGGG